MRSSKRRINNTKTCLVDLINSHGCRSVQAINVNSIHRAECRTFAVDTFIYLKCNIDSAERTAVASYPVFHIDFFFDSRCRNARNIEDSGTNDKLAAIAETKHCNLFQTEYVDLIQMTLEYISIRVLVYSNSMV